MAVANGHLHTGGAGRAVRGARRQAAFRGTLHGRSSKGEAGRGGMPLPPPAPPHVSRSRRMGAHTLPAGLLGSAGSPGRSHAAAAGGRAVAGGVVSLISGL